MLQVFPQPSIVHWKLGASQFPPRGRLPPPAAFPAPATPSTPAPVTAPSSFTPDDPSPSPSPPPPPPPPSPPPPSPPSALSPSPAPAPPSAAGAAPPRGSSTRDRAETSEPNLANPETWAGDMGLPGNVARAVRVVSAGVKFAALAARSPASVSHFTLTSVKPPPFS